MERGGEEGVDFLYYKHYQMPTLQNIAAIQIRCIMYCRKDVVSYMISGVANDEVNVPGSNRSNKLLSRRLPK